MAHKGYLKVALNKETKKGQPYVSALILKTPDAEDGEWFSIFDAQWFGGTEKKPSVYDIRPYASKDDPYPVVYVYTTSGDFKNVTAIRPADEEWVAGTEPGQMPLDSEKQASKETTGKKAGEGDEAKQSPSQSMTGRELVAEGIEKLIDGIYLVIRERLEEEE